MIQGRADIQQGAIEPVYGTLSVPAGSTITLNSGTFELLDPARQPVNGMTNLSLTGSSGSGSASLTVEYTLDTSNLPVGSYLGIFNLDVTPSDNIERPVKPILTDIFIHGAS